MFRTLRKINMKLNPKKCTFGAVEGMFLGYMIGPEGIKPCPEKIEAVLQLPSPRTVKEVQSLNGKLAGLNRFLSKSAEKSLPLFKTLKKCVKKSDFRWTPEAEQAFKQLKQHISRREISLGWRKVRLSIGVPRPKEEAYNVHISSPRARSTDFLVEKPEEALADMSEKEAPKNAQKAIQDGSVMFCIIVKQSGRGTSIKVHPRARGGGRGRGRRPNLDNTHNKVPERWGPPGRQEGG
ncbi:hypothetical protein Tco_1107053 [Tanacetum coccineum]